MNRYIIMCDIIGSRQQQQKLVMQQFKSCTQYINDKYEKSILSPLTITLGDEFQAVIKSLDACIQILIDLEEYIIAQQYLFKLRYVVHYGKIETKINTEIAYEMLGPGLTDARMFITSLKKSNERFYFKIKNETLGQIINHSFTILQQIVDNWAIEKDHAILHNFIQYKDYKVVADKLQKDRSLMWKREKSLHLVSYNSVKEILKNVTLL